MQQELLPVLLMQLELMLQLGAADVAGFADITDYRSWSCC
jgi:hypothetical protein